MPVILNETKQARYIIQTGEIGARPAASLFLMGKYYRQKEKLSKEETFMKLNEFMERHYKNYNAASWEDILEDIAAKTVKYPLQEIASVGITRPELTQIASIGPVKYQKLLFTMLCYAKLYNMLSETNDGWVNTDIRELYKSARVTVKYKKDKFLYLNDIESTGMISFSNKNDNLNMKVNFIDMSGKPVLNIEDFRELGYEYLYFTGKDRFIRCSECQRLIRQTGKNTRYCDSCKQKKRLEAKRNWWKNNH